MGKKGHGQPKRPERHSPFPEWAQCVACIFTGAHGCGRGCAGRVSQNVVENSVSSVVPWEESTTRYSTHDDARFLDMDRSSGRAMNAWKAKYNVNQNRKSWTTRNLVPSWNSIAKHADDMMHDEPYAIDAHLSEIGAPTYSVPFPR